MPKVIQLERELSRTPHPALLALLPTPKGSAPPPPRCESLGPAPLESFLGRGAVGRALPGFHAFPGRRVGGLPADESWLHLGCHKMFSSSKYGSASSKWNSELITNGLKSQSHLKNSHIQPARNQGARAVAPSQTQGGAVCGLRGPRQGRPAPQLTLCGNLDLPQPLLCLVPFCKMRDLVTPTTTASGSGLFRLFLYLSLHPCLRGPI